MDVFLSIVFKIVGVVMLILTVLSAILLVLTFSKPRKVSIPSLLIMIAIGLVTFIVFASLTNYQPQPWIWYVMGITGIGAGIVQARTTRIYIEHNQVMSRNSVWYLVVWSSLLAINQLIIIVTNRPPDIAMALLIMGTTVIWGTNGDIIRRYFKSVNSMKPAATTVGTASIDKSNNVPVAPVNTDDTKLFCPACGKTAGGGDQFCTGCGGRV